MILLIDNYDSFTYNLYQMLAQLEDEVSVIRNDTHSVEEILAMHPTGIVLSPGPGRPEEAGILLELIQRSISTIPLLGVCLGHQAIAQALGAKVILAKETVHGKKGSIFHNRQGLFQGLPLPFEAGRYHSLIVDKHTLPEEFEIQAELADGELMAIKHKLYPCCGIQFHPESILTSKGLKLMQNFRDLYVREHATSSLK